MSGLAKMQDWAKAWRWNWLRLQVDHLPTWVDEAMFLMVQARAARLPSAGERGR